MQHALFTQIINFHTADIDHKFSLHKILLQEDESYCFSTATRHGHDMYEVNAKKDPSKLQQHVEVSALQCLATRSAAILSLHGTCSFTGSVMLMWCSEDNRSEQWSDELANLL